MKLLHLKIASIYPKLKQMKLFTSIILFAFVVSATATVSDRTGDLISTSKDLVRKCPKKGSTKWCARLKKCVKPCRGCLEPRVVGQEYVCGPRECRKWEKCIEQRTCAGSIFGKDYAYQPNSNDPCAEEFFY